VAMMDGFKITEPQDVLKQLKDYRNNYHEKGVYLGFEELDRHYSMQLGNCTDWTGYPMSGKTQVLMELLMNTSIFYGWKHLIYFPDVGNNVEILADFINKKTSKSFDPKKPNTITDEEIEREIEWVTNHFKVLTKVDVKAKLTPMQFWDMAADIKKTEILHTASIDSWKDMSHPYDQYGGYATYLEFCLPYRNHIAEEHNLHLHTIIHPKLTEKVNGVRNPPTPYDLKGGSEWFNSGKSMITVHRPDTMHNQCEIYFNKIKPRSVGSIGKCDLHFDVNSLTYYVIDVVAPNEHNKLYASPKGQVKNTKLISEPVQNFYQPLQPNINFNDDLPF
jgi:hypothetical protein